MRDLEEVASLQGACIKGFVVGSEICPAALTNVEKGFRDNCFAVISVWIVGTFAGFGIVAFQCEHIWRLDVAAVFLLFV